MTRTPRAGRDAHFTHILLAALMKSAESTLGRQVQRSYVNCDGLKICVCACKCRCMVQRVQTGCPAPAREVKSLAPLIRGPHHKPHDNHIIYHMITLRPHTFSFLQMWAMMRRISSHGMPDEEQYSNDTGGLTSTAWVREMARDLRSS